MVAVPEAVVAPIGANGLRRPWVVTGCNWILMSWSTANAGFEKIEASRRSAERFLRSATTWDSFAGDAEEDAGAAAIGLDPELETSPPVEAAGLFVPLPKKFIAI